MRFNRPYEEPARLVLAPASERLESNSFIPCSIATRRFEVRLGERLKPD